MLAALQAELDALARDETARVVVIGRRRQGLLRRPRPEGDAGRAVARLLPRLFAACTDVMLAIQRLPVPVIARVQGIATAAGCQLVGDVRSRRRLDARRASR